MIVCGSVTTECCVCGKGVVFYVKGHADLTEITKAYCPDCQAPAPSARRVQLLPDQVNIFHEGAHGWERKPLTKN